MKAFSRSLFKLNVSKETHHHLMSLFAILLNSTELEGAFVLYAQIVYVYGDPYLDNSSDALASLLRKSDSCEFDIESYLQESDVKDDKPIKQDFLDETDITMDPIIHQSLFIVKACDNIPYLRQIIQKEELHKEPNEWQRRARSNTTNGKHRFYFNDKLGQTNACKLSKGKMNKQIIAFDDRSIPTKKHSPTNMPVNFDGPLSDSSHNSINDHSLGFSIVSSNALKKKEENTCDSKVISRSSSLINLNRSPAKFSDSSFNIFSTLLAGNGVNDLDNVYYKTDERHDANDYDCVVDNTSLSQAFSPKRSYPSSDSGYSMSKRKRQNAQKIAIKKSESFATKLN
ncbi:unnamed protein product [Didymodactylos carnosus]|uniref:Uncharacterized protein n=1 Tax=Didymodactylos carnosus TaxID=1234261 RepID=A0A8S2E6C2_9BILA|nr:unnamed protein product [Didymodactylos carnosus]CAF3944055.1 unnamed protein product [Didymodactylos carnosus]